MYTPEELAKLLKRIAQRVKDGAGQGRGSEYIPWLKVCNVPSAGLCSRKRGWKTNRVQHLFSLVEKSYFHCLEWAPSVVDTREQYPLLPLEETLEIAKQCGIRHPTNPKTKLPEVMTTDFLITSRNELESREIARYVKPSEKLAGKRVHEKMEIERRYWQSRNVDWGIVTEREIPTALATNVDWVHGAYWLADCNLEAADVFRIKEVLEPDLVAVAATPLVTLCSASDDRLGLKPGDSLTAARHLIARKVWVVEMNEPIKPGTPLRLLATLPYNASEP